MTYLTIQTDDSTTVTQVIRTEYRLDEVVQITSSPAPDAIRVCDQLIELTLDWDNTLPPVLLPRPLPFTPENLLAIVFMRLDNWEKAYEYVRHDRALADTVDLINRLQSGVAPKIPARPLNGKGTFGIYQRWHNRAVALHYGDVESGPDESSEAYRAAIAHAPDAEHRAFTAKHYATLLLDTGQLTEADRVIDEASQATNSEAARHELLAVQYAVWMQQLTVPYDPTLLARTKEAIWQVLQYYESQQRSVQIAMLLVDAGHVANFSNSFAEALGYLNRAIGIFREEDLPELLANAQYHKGILLYTWAQNGSPQFYRPAMEAYQEALKVFTQQTAPAIFADIHHHLGVIFSEIQDEAKKKSLWAAVSSSSFQQALAYYTKEDYPYEYAAISNHYANALTKYPPAARFDNYAKALGLYRDALRIRRADTYPYERALTILNYLEAGWYVSEEDPADQRALFNDMVRKASEVDTLVTDEKLIDEARHHLDRLAQLSLSLA